MQRMLAAVVTLCLFAAVTALAQEEIEGAGTPGYVPLFTGYHRVGDANIFQSLDGDIGIGTTAPDSTMRIVNTGNSVSVVGVPQPYGIYATLQNSTINFSSAIRGDALGTSGGVAGLIGTTYSHDGWGVNGVSLNPDGGGYGVLGSLIAASGSGGGGGVLGTTQMTATFTSGVRGESFGTSGGSVAVYGEAFSPDGSAGLFINRASGNMLLGSSGGPNLFRVDGTGRVFADGGFQPAAQTLPSLSWSRGTAQSMKPETCQ